MDFTFLVISIYFICNFDWNFFSSAPRASLEARERYEGDSIHLLFYLFVAMYMYYVCAGVCFSVCVQCNDLELRLVCIFRVFCIPFLHLPAGLFIGFWLRVARRCAKFSWSANSHRALERGGICGPKGCQCVEQTFFSTAQSAWLKVQMDGAYKCSLVFLLFRKL